MCCARGFPPCKFLRGQLELHPWVMERSTAAVAVWLRVLLLATPLHASLIAPSVQLQGGAPAGSAAATQRRGAGLHTFCMRAIGVDSEASLDGLDSLDEDSHVRLTGDPAADAMIRRKMGIPATKSSKSKLVAKKLRREDMVEAKGHRVGERMSGGRRASEVATGVGATGAGASAAGACAFCAGAVSAVGCVSCAAGWSSLALAVQLTSICWSETSFSPYQEGQY